MKIRNFLHKGLQRLYSEGNAKGVSPDIVDKLRKMFAFLDTMADPDELRQLPGGHAWKWRFQAAEPYKAITVTLVRSARKADGASERHTITSQTYVSGNPRTADDILILCADEKGDLRYGIALPRGSWRAAMRIARPGRTRDGTGGPRRVWSGRASGTIRTGRPIWRPTSRWWA